MRCCRYYIDGIWVLQKRQLDWNGGGKIYHYDHLALSSDRHPEHRSTSEEDSSSSSSEEDPVYVAGLSKSGLPGDPGIDYPILPSIPLTDFHCRGRTPGFYGDTQTACQVSHQRTFHFVTFDDSWHDGQSSADVLFFK
jgi:hypothetical protein